MTKQKHTRMCMSAKETETPWAKVKDDNQVTLISILQVNLLSYLQAGSQMCGQAQTQQIISFYLWMVRFP